MIYRPVSGLGFVQPELPPVVLCWELEAACELLDDELLELLLEELLVAFRSGRSEAT